MVGSSRISYLLSADYLVLLASFEPGLQHALDRFAIVCNESRIKISIKTEKTEALCFSRNPDEWSK